MWLAFKLINFQFGTLPWIFPNKCYKEKEKKIVNKEIFKILLKKYKLLDFWVSEHIGKEGANYNYMTNLLLNIYWTTEVIELLKAI